jgi:hypothetical protein
MRGFAFRSLLCDLLGRPTGGDKAEPYHLQFWRRNPTDLSGVLRGVTLKASSQKPKVDEQAAFSNFSPSSPA